MTEEKERRIFDAMKRITLAKPAASQYDFQPGDRLRLTKAGREAFRRLGQNVGTFVKYGRVSFGAKRSVHVRLTGYGRTPVIFSEEFWEPDVP